MKLLFVCNQGMHRSCTAAELFSKQHETKYAGIYSEQDPVTQELLSWADEVIVMEEHQRKEIGLRFPKPYLQKKIVCWDIPDVYSYGQEELITILKEKDMLV